MKPRVITVVSTNTNSRHQITTDASTLGELKKACDAAGINYEGLDWFEGLSNTELRGDDSILPKDLPYKGTITNELVILLTPGQRKIKNGSIAMTRAEIYAYIKKHCLQLPIMKKFGKVYSSCGTNDLLQFISSLKDATKKTTPKCTCHPLQTRSEAYDFINKHDLKEKVKKMIGRVYSSVSTDDLLAFCNAYIECARKKSARKPAAEASTASKLTSEDIDAIIRKVGF